MAFLVTDNAGALAGLARLYQIATGQAPDGTGLAYWAERVDSGAVDLADVAAEFAFVRPVAERFSADLATADFVAAAYEAALGRSPDAAGAAFWSAQIEAGLPRSALLAAFAASEEAAARIDVVGAEGLAIDDFQVPAFRYGVASGDPAADSVVLWTHARPADTDAPVALAWEVSTTEDFSSVVASGTGTARPEDSHTFKVVPDGLAAGQTYFYRFSTGDETSMTGTTRTLPEGPLDALTLAVFSCTNYPAGYFNAYAQAVADGFDFSVHLGDYIYEYGRDGYASGQAEAFGRLSDPANEIVTAEDYAARYAQYHSDADMQAWRAHAPLIAMWDDHESANDSWETGAENHQPATEGDWEDRRDAALEAYFDWMPVREPASGDLRDYDRAYDFGDLATLHMLETRLQARDETRGDTGSAVAARVGAYVGDETGASFAADLQAFPQLVPEGVDTGDPAQLAALARNEDFVAQLALTALLAEAADPDREMIGAAQFAEFQGRLAASEATWQIVGSQTLFNEMTLPVPLLLDPATLPAYIGIAGKLAAGAPLSAEEQALVDAPRIPYNLDSWDGYQAERDAIVEALLAEDANGLVIAGDTHNSWAGPVRGADGALAAYHFSGPGVSSPGLETLLEGVPPAAVAQVFVSFIDSLDYADTARRGYMSLEITPEGVSTDYNFQAVDRLDYVNEIETVGIEIDAFA